jgi:hypothetical protein
MKLVQMFAFASLAAALVAIGCGGSGNGSAGVAPAPVLSSTPRVEAIVKVLPTNIMNPDEWTAAQLLNPQTPGLQADLINPTVFGVEDPMNMEAGEDVVFQLVTYTVTNGNIVRNILSGVTFQSSDVTSTYGTIAQNTGDFIAGPAKTPGTYWVTAFYNGVSYSTPYKIQVDQVRLLATVLAQGTNANQLAGTELQFFDNSNTLVDTVTVQFDGSIRASIPTTAASFTVVADSVPGAFYQSFNYLSLQYDAGLSGCYASLPSGLINGTASLNAPIYIAPRSGGQKPLATGCTVTGDSVQPSKKK